MPEKGYFLRLTGAMLLGAVSLVIAIIAVLVLSPYIFPILSAALPFLFGTMLVIVAVVIIWVLIYAFAMIGVAVYYAIKHPAEVNTSSSGYSIDKVKESGRREKKGEEE